MVHRAADCVVQRAVQADTLGPPGRALQNVSISRHFQEQFGFIVLLTIRSNVVAFRGGVFSQDIVQQEVLLRFRVGGPCDSMWCILTVRSRRP
jgi:hypothetical protein